MPSEIHEGDIQSALRHNDACDAVLDDPGGHVVTLEADAGADLRDTEPAGGMPGREADRSELDGRALDKLAVDAFEATSARQSVVTGHVDGFIGRQVHGWAADADGDGNCLIEVRDAHGRTLGRGRCGRSRADLADQPFGRIDLGFLVQLDAYADGHGIHVFADGVELPGSPIATGADRFDGFIHVLGDRVSGWVDRRSDDDTPPIITLTLPDGTPVGSGLAHRRPEDDTHSAFQPFHFMIELSGACCGMPEFIVLAAADGVPFAQDTGKLALDGYIDYLAPDCVSGWLVLPGAPRRKLVLTAWRGDRMLGKAVCNQPRADLKSKHPEQWKAGFNIALRDDDRRLSALHGLSLRIEGGTREVLGGPFLMGHRSAFVATAKRLSVSLAGLDQQLGYEEHALFQDMISHYVALRRHGPDQLRIQVQKQATVERSIAVLVPVYKGVELTEACLRSVLRELGPGDRLVVVADRPPEAAMLPMLRRFRREDPITLLVNEVNLGFVGAVNRGLDFIDDSHVLLLNSDTRLFPGGLDELRSVLLSAGDIGTVTAMSNNATIFSYPHPRMARVALADCAWPDLARVALEHGAGRIVDVPTGHGFCMLVRRQMLDRVGKLSEAFGRGYGEENDLCLRGSDIGYRHVAALGALVEHRESVSFGDERAELIAANMPQLEGMYPEYTPTIMEFERTDPLRVARWALDRFRLRAAHARGTRFVLSVVNSLSGGTGKAARDIARLVGYAGRTEMRLVSCEDGALRLEANEPELCAVFAANDAAALIDVLEDAGIELVIFHQLLGMRAATIAALSEWAGGRRSVFYAHDFYALCPRVTMINAVDRFCDVAPVSVCARCVEMGGAHETSALEDLSPAGHRELFRTFIGNMAAIVAPSRDAVGYLSRVFRHPNILAIPHPVEHTQTIPPLRRGDPNRIVLLGAIGPHKGSRHLRDIASRALLTHPHLHFTVIGFTDCDDVLSALDNVTITGPYEAGDLPLLIARANPVAALFLHNWPETYSYTLSEAASFGLLPVVPDIGAPAERVRDSGFGLVFPFPVDAASVLDLLGTLKERVADIEGTPADLIVTGTATLVDAVLNGTPVAFGPDDQPAERTVAAEIV